MEHAQTIKQPATKPLYSVGTWCTERQAYSPQKGLAGPSLNITLPQLRQRLRELRKLGYSAHRYREEDGTHDDNDWFVMIERTDGATPLSIRRGWRR